MLRPWNGNCSVPLYIAKHQDITIWYHRCVAIVNVTSKIVLLEILYFKRMQAGCNLYGHLIAWYLQLKSDFFGLT